MNAARRDGPFDAFYESWNPMIDIIASLPAQCTLSCLRLHFHVSDYSVRPDALEYVDHVNWGRLAQVIERFRKLENVEAGVMMHDVAFPFSVTEPMSQDTSEVQYVLDFFRVGLQDLCAPGRRYQTTIAFLDDIRSADAGGAC